MEQKSLSVLVPVYNEEYLVEKSLQRLFELGRSPHLERIEVIVVNDCSTDGTAAVLRDLAQRFPAVDPKFTWRFHHHERNMGKGKAIQTALKAAGGDITIIHDADLEYHPRDILRMIPLFITENADAVYGSRFTPHEYRRVLMYRHELGNRFLTFLSNLISNLNLTDMETCYKAVRTELLKSIPIRSNDFRMEPELTIKLAKRGARIYEIPINYSGRTYNEGKKINWKDGVKAIWAILKFGFSDDIFTEDEYGSKILARLSRARNFNQWMSDTIAPYVGQNVLEIGAGIGNLTKQLIPRKQYFATDINPLYLKMTENIKSDKPYLRVEYLDLNDVSGFLEKKHPIDTVVCLNVIEHLENDTAAMRNIADLLSPGGRAIILVPNGQWLYGSLDQVLGHCRRYSAAGLRSLGLSADLETEKLIEFNRVSSIPWYINGKILKKRTFGLFQILMLNWLTPVFRILDRFMPTPPLSHIAIFKKPGGAA